MMYVVLMLMVCILLFIWLIIRAYNRPKWAKERTKQVETRQKEKTARWRLRRRK